MSYDRDFYFKNKQERWLLDYSWLDKLNQIVYGQTGVIERSAYCVAIHDELIFVGFAKGVIKIFDRKKEIEIKTLTCR